MVPVKPRFSRSAGSAYRYARGYLIVLIALTVVNCIFYLLGEDTYYAASIMLVYGMFEPSFPEIIVPLLIFAVFVAAWILSKRKPGWMVVALVLFILDTLYIFVLALGYSSYYGIGLGTALLQFALDLIIHVIGLVILAIGVKKRKIGTMTDEELTAAGTAAGVAAARIEGVPEEDFAPEIPCSFTVFSPGARRSAYSSGALRFGPERLVLGGRTALSQALIGVLAPLKEVAGVSYEEIGPVTIANRHQTSFSFQLTDGRTVTLSLARRERERLYQLMEQHGVTMPPLS
jgi:hypothetical protein